MEPSSSSARCREKRRGSAEVRWTNSRIGMAGNLPVHPSTIQPADEPHRHGSTAVFKNSAGREKSNPTNSDFPPIFTFFLGEIGQNRWNSSIIKIV
jgi:hypothetical protein